MKNKVTSLLLGITIGGILVIGHDFYFTDTKDVHKNTGVKGKINDEQISRISERTGMSEEDIKSKLESGETMKNIIGVTSRPEGGGEGREKSE